MFGCSDVYHWMGRAAKAVCSANSLVVGAVDPNQPVTVLGVSPARDWVLIGTAGQRGWVDARYVYCP